VKDLCLARFPARSNAGNVTNKYSLINIGEIAMLPLFAYGSTFDYTLPDGATAYQTTYSIADADLYINIGDAVFICETDDTDLEYLGSVTAIDAISIITQSGPKFSKNPGAKLWIPDKVFRFPISPEPSMRLPINTGVETLITSDGRIVQTRTNKPIFREKLLFNGISYNDFQKFTQWLKERIDWGIFAFHYVDTHRNVCLARLEKITDPHVEKETESFNLLILLLIESQS
jgi:hypothetical protein